MISFIPRASFFATVLLAVQTFASPIAHNHPGDKRQELSRRTDTTLNAPFSLNGWGGFQSLNGFDDFFGINNFDGSHNQQILLVGNQAVCSAQQVVIVQQQLAILQELAKRIILEQVCEVEVQTIILDQFQGGFNLFGRDLKHENGRVAGFDANIAALIIQLLDDQNRFRNVDFGFKGHNIGHNTIVPSGNNFVDVKSLEAILLAQKASQQALASVQFIL